MHYLEEEFQALFGDPATLESFIDFALVDGAWLWDVEQPDNEWMSPAFWRTLGYDPASMPHSPAAWQDLIHPDDLKVAIENYERHCADASHPYDQIVRYRHKDGSTVYVRCRGYAIRDETGRARRLLGIHTNITEREARLAQVETQLKATLEAASSAIFGLSADGEVVVANSAARHVLGGRTEATPFPWPEQIQFLDPKDMCPIQDDAHPITRALAGQTIGGEVHLMTRSGSEAHRYVRVASSPLPQSVSDLFTVVILDDVSAQELNRQQLERHSRLDALGQLTGGIAHDFNNLLSTVLYAVELIRREPLSEGGARSAETAITTVRRGAELTNRLLAFARRQPTRATSQRVSEVWANLRLITERTIEEVIEVEFLDVDSATFVYCDQGQLENALLNLILNSRDAILRDNRGGKITVGARIVEAAALNAPLATSGVYTGEGRRSSDEADTARDDGRGQRYVEIRVADDGPGMSDAVKARAVDPFFTTKHANSGTGLGLSMVYGFVQQADGEMRIYSEPGQGATVRLYLPLGVEDAGKEQPHTVEPVVDGRRETILLVEDEAWLLEQLGDILEAINYATIRASSGREALDLLDAGAKPNLLLTDIVMPGGVSGFDLAHRARKLNPDLPVVYMSGYTGYVSEEMGEVRAPMLAKPCDIAELSRELRRALERSQA